MPIVQVSHQSATLTPRPDAPIAMARRGATCRSATYPPVAFTAYHDGELRRELECLFAACLDDASELAISVVGGCVLLQGSVSSSLDRTLAEELVLSIPEIRECVNRMVVRAPRDGGSIAA
jgi:osmotically-inducible protein OsmY